jgi:hypothetical protein
MNNIQTCLEMIKFGMMNTILTFVNKYYLYDGDCLTEMKGLTIGGYESAWLADLAMLYLLDKMGDDRVDNNLLNELTYFGIYHDNGIGIFNGQQTKQEISSWLEQFQAKIDEAAGNDCLRFTAVVWKPSTIDHDTRKATTSTTNAWHDPQVSATTDSTFPFLDMELSWTSDATLSFGVHLKPNQQLKYLNNSSSHTDSCLKAITNSV